MPTAPSQSYLNTAMQIGLVFFTLLGFLLTAMKLPQYGLASNLFAQIFWFYTSIKAWREANQIGILINTIVVTLIVAYGVLNYWILS